METVNKPFLTWTSAPMAKEYERHYEKARQTSASFVRSRPHSLLLLKGLEGHGVTMLWVDKAGTNHESFFDLVILSVGLSNPESTKEPAKTCRIELDHYGLAKTSSFSPSVSSRPGFFVTDSYQSPKAIPKSVAVAFTAAARPRQSWHLQETPRPLKKKFVEEFDNSGKKNASGCLWFHAGEGCQ